MDTIIQEVLDGEYADIKKYLQASLERYVWNGQDYVMIQVSDEGGFHLPSPLEATNI